MTEGTVSWNDYCPRCEKSTPQNFGFGKMRLCGNCLKVIDDHEQEQNLKEGIFNVKKNYNRNIFNESKA